jgi:glycosyltransferase involved in cell wall biosynthesis
MNKLSVCMIVKNEAILLARCLDSLRDAADEIVVVDTGSADDTAGIAKKKGCRVIGWEWRDDFAMARNISIRAASGEWILWLDADDIIPPLSISLLKEMKLEAPDKVFGMIVRNQKPNNTGSEFVQARMFPNRPEIFFEGRIHEQMMPSALRLGLRMVEKPVIIEHHGYADPVQMRNKARRNVALLLHEIDPARPEQVTLIEIADSYTILEQWDQAQMWYERLLGLASRSDVLASQAHVGLGTIFNKRDEYALAENHFGAACRLCPDRVDAFYGLAVAQEMGGSVDAAIATLQKILTITPRIIQVGVDHRQTIIKTNLRLGRLYWENNRHEALEHLVRQALKGYADRPEIRNMTGTAYIHMGRLMEALHAFEQSLGIVVEGNLDAYIGLCVIYAKANRSERCDTTLAGIRGLYSGMPRYWAGVKLLASPGLSLPSRPADITVDALEKELAYLRRTYGL